MIAIFCALPSEYMNLIRFIRKKDQLYSYKNHQRFREWGVCGYFKSNTLCSHQTAGGIYRSHDHKPDFIWIQIIGKLQVMTAGRTGGNSHSFLCKLNVLLYRDCLIHNSLLSFTFLPNCFNQNIRWYAAHHRCLVRFLHRNVRIPLYCRHKCQLNIAL